MSLPYVRRRLTHALQTLARYLGAPPASPTPLTSEWISTRCEGLDASAAVVEVALDEESGENGAVARVALGGERLVVKRPPASPAARAVAAIQQWYAREVHWYAALAPIAGVRCPRCHCARYDALTGEYVLVLEDLRAAGCRPLAVAEATAAATTLGRLHGRFAGAFDDDARREIVRGAFDDDARREIVRGPLPIMPITLALATPIEKFFRDCWKAVRGERRYALAELLADRGEAAGPAAISLLDALAVPGAYASMTEALAAPPRTLLHGDFRPENMMVEDATGEVVVYDWQFASVGNGAYDLAYFSALVADPDDRRRLDPELRRAYVSGLVGSGAAAPCDLERDLRYGCLLALASFVMGAAVAGDDAASVETHRRGLRRLAAAALDWGAAAC